MIDAAANDALDALEACPCCLLGPQQRCLKTPYTHLDTTEIYSDMLKECFNIQLDETNDKTGICEECVARLRDASHFKRQVQRSQVQLKERLARALKIIESVPPAVVKSEIADEDGESANLLVEPPVEMANDTGMSEDSADCDYFPRCDSGSAHALSARSLSARARQQLAMTCTVRLERLRDEDHEHTRDTTGTQLTSKPSPLTLQEHTRDTSGTQLTSKPSPLTLQEHTRDTSGTQLTRNPSPLKPYNCDICHKQFTWKNDLTRHTRIHTGQKPYTCDICNKKYTWKSHLQRHVITHTGQKPYTCDICNKQFTRNSHLQRHVITHTGQKPYTCDICNKQFTRKGTLQGHVRIHTGQKPYTCDICNKQFTRKGTLQRHVIIHTGQKPYTCDICNKQFTRKDDLNKHVRILHSRHTLA